MGKAILRNVISRYDAELVRPGGEVDMSVENAFMVHDWNKIMASPVMKQGIKRS
jgi:hypothetical protein